uniref:Uncharacterized protein n=1 Tax=Arundo donax TaxID=35708 RepID=A0A0A9DDN7_ARUDO
MVVARSTPGAMRRIWRLRHLHCSACLGTAATSSTAVTISMYVCVGGLHATSMCRETPPATAVGGGYCSRVTGPTIRKGVCAVEARMLGI